MRVVAEERDGEAQGSMTVLHSASFYVGERNLRHQQVKSESTFGALVLKHKGTVFVKLTCKDWLSPQLKICYCTCSSQH